MLRKLSSRDLRDVGLIECDVDTAYSKPLSANAATELHDVIGQRSLNW